MTGNSSIDISVANIWRAYVAFRKGKKPSKAIRLFEYNLLDNILTLALDIQKGRYEHGTYDHMIVNDNKRRDIAVASVRDRVVHRLLYDYLVPIWDKTFIYDAWSCRQNKGLYGAIDRAQLFMHKYDDGWVWRADITKLFDSVDQQTIKRLLRMRIIDPVTLWLLDETLDSYSSFHEGRGIPIGNLTSQILANVYLHEFDRYMSHCLKPYAYLRYGDDWLCFAATRSDLEAIRIEAQQFLTSELNLRVHATTNFIRPVSRGVTYLGIDLWPSGHRLDKAARRKIETHLDRKNIASYKSLVAYHQSLRHVKELEWALAEQLG